MHDHMLEVMNFLNEVVVNYPNAISLSSGRPYDKFFNIESVDRYVSEYISWRGGSIESDIDKLKKDIAQYGKTKGIINDAIAQMLVNDEYVDVAPDNILVTNGCQEAMALCLDTLFERERDVIAVVDPTYIGMTGIAKIKGIEIVAIGYDKKGPLIDQIVTESHQLERAGKKLKGIYVIPDFNNPIGDTMSLSVREDLLRCCADNDILIFEDNPYGMFRYDGDKMPSLLAMDTRGLVYYFGSFSKTLFPSVRIGFVANKDGRFIDELTKTKSMTSVNTSQLMQAYVGGVLAEQNFSLQRSVDPSVAFYRENRDVMLASLAEHLGPGSGVNDKFSWNSPEGGFFLTIQLPFEFAENEVSVCAENYGVVCMPISFFSINRPESVMKKARLAFSSVAPDEIREGVARFCTFCKDTIG
jgi:(S)-3,5-dihydroxyphenylglycine transaminase